jgi:hypothetical protein
MTAVACTCPVHWRRLYTVIAGKRYTVEPAPADTPSSRLFRAWCAGCGAEFTYPFRIAEFGEQRAA